MKLGTKGRYAVTSMVDLASHDQMEAVSLNDISERTEISLSYLEQLFMNLRKAGLVQSSRGPGGGYRLGRPAKEIYIAEILNAVNENIQTTRCDPNSMIGCRSNKGRCATHDLWEALGKQMFHFLEQVSVRDVLEGNLLDSTRVKLKKKIINGEVI